MKKVAVPDKTGSSSEGRGAVELDLAVGAAGIGGSTANAGSAVVETAAGKGDAVG